MRCGAVVDGCPRRVSGSRCFGISDTAISGTSMVLVSVGLGNEGYWRAGGSCEGMERSLDRNTAQIGNPG